jgi:hypothetical protein|tara:strand:+ start:12969 stop:13595 length:627 start_codon:yes stop_codon:yes gene_type:complete
MIIGLVGFIGSGKNTVAEQFVKQGFAQDSFASPLKDAVSNIFGWPREMLEGDTEQSRLFRESVDGYWSQKLQNKRFTPRLALQVIGTEIFRENFNPSIWLHSLENRYMASGRKPTVVSDCRFKNELGLIKTMGGVAIRVKRGPEPHWYGTAELAADGDVFSQNTLHDMGVHSSEWDWVNMRVDYTVENNGTIEELEKTVQDITKKIKP